MYYTNEEHRQNFEFLLLKYKHYKNDKQHLSALYVAAVPDVFELLDLEELEDGNPLVHVLEYSKEKEQMVPGHPGLTGTTSQLVMIGASLYNGTPCDLDYGFSREFAKVVITACEIRYGITDTNPDYYKNDGGYSIIN
jgi:Protein of unknown function (DUF2538)